MIWTIMWLVLQLVVGLLYASLFEYLAHKYVLHGLGIKPNSFWSAHWHRHHKNARKNKFYDADYERGFLKWDRHAKEFMCVAALVVEHLLVFGWVAPVFTLVVCAYGLAYLYLHRKMHLRPVWGRAKYPHHYDHHLGVSQNQNWGVVTCWWDKWLGTRVSYKYDQNGKVIVPRSYV